ncbi:hypothetical protein ACJJTC_019598 [Scirpophaga incertulas]
MANLDKKDNTLTNLLAKINLRLSNLERDRSRQRFNYQRPQSKSSSRKEGSQVAFPVALELYFPGASSPRGWAPYALLSRSVCVVRIVNSRLPKAVFYSELSCGKRKPGGQYLKYKDVLKRHLLACSMSSDRWEDLALQRTEWRSTVHKSTKHFEQMRLEELDEKRLLSKARPKPTYSYTYTNGQLHCAVCSRYFKKKFVYASYIRAFHKEKLVYN